MAKKSPSLNIGISDKDRAAIAAGLSKLLAETHAYPDHAQLPLERDGPAVQQPARHVHGPVHRAVGTLWT